jgi:hypothetical protein
MRRVPQALLVPILAVALALLAEDVSAQGSLTFDLCGTIVPGVTCPLVFQAAGGGTIFQLSTYGSFGVGDEVHVVGTIDPGCFTICMQGQCIVVSLIELCTPIPPPLDEYVRGDCNDDGTTNIADAIFELAALFTPGAEQPACDDACDTNDDGSLDIADAIAALTALFGVPPVPLPAPNPACGEDPTDGDALDCAAFGGC